MTIIAYDDTATATLPRLRVADVVAKQCAQGNSTEAIAKSLDPQIREMLSSPKFATRPAAGILIAAGLVRMDKASLLTLLNARCNSAEDFELQRGLKKRKPAWPTWTTRTLRPGTGDLLGGNITTLAEQFSDDFDV